MGGCVCIEVFDPAVLRGYQQFAYERGGVQQAVLAVSLCYGAVHH